MRTALLILIVILCVVITCGVFSNFGIFGSIPDLLICVLVSLALYEQSYAILFMGAFGGLLFDVLYSQALGMFALPYFLTAALCMFVSAKIHINEKIIYPAILGFLLFLFKDALSLGISYLFGNRVDIVFMLLRFSMPGAVITGILTPIVYLLIRLLFKIRLFKRTRFDDLKHL